MKKEIPLNNGLSIPILGFGTWKLEGQECSTAVKTALAVGYRHIDTADAYGNHHEVAMAIKESRVPRKEIFLTTKVWWTDLAKDRVLGSARRFLHELQVDYLDLLLIHWPNKAIPLRETLEGMLELQKEGLVHTIGVSNFTIKHLQEVAEAGIQIGVNQVEFHPSLFQKELLDYCQKRGIVLTAYSPIAQGDDLRLPVIQELAKKYQRSQANIVLNWIMSKKIVAIPRSANPENIKENFNALEFSLSFDDIAKIDQIGGNHRIVKPEFAEFED